MNFKIYLSGLILLGLQFNLQAQEANLSQANDLMLKAFTASTHTKTEEQITKNIVDENTKQYFKKASKTYQVAYEKNKDNASINYKLGLCYYFSEDQQLKALPLLLKASKKLTNMYDFFSDKESNAPNNTLYFLAASYLEANKPDSALYYFSLYNDKIKTNAINDDRDIAFCYNAKESEKHVRNVTVKNISSEINTPFAEKNPVVKIDNTILFFSSNRKDKDTTTNQSDDIYFSKKELSGNWYAPEPFPFNTEFDEVPLALSVDGNTLYIRRTIKGNSDIYSSVYVNNKWEKPAPLEAINSEYNENGFSITSDGNTIYFSSDRNKEKGKNDIFVCKKDPKGKWGDIKILPSNINSAFNEISPFINPDGKTLFFSSDGYDHKGIGGFDIYYTEQEKEGVWSIPQSMSSPINTTRNDINYYIAAENKRYFSRLNNDQSYDIYAITGEGFNFETISSATDVVTVTSEMGVTQLLETEKQVEKEVEVVTTVETEVEKIVEMPDNKVIDQVKIEELNTKDRQKLVDKVKSYLTQQLKENLSVSFKTVYFDVNKSNLSLLSIHELDILVQFMKENPHTKVEVVGNTDSKGTWQRNLELSNERAKQVYDFLIKNNVSPERLYFYGRSSAVPLVSNDTEENRAKNRRVEVILLR